MGREKFCETHEGALIAEGWVVGAEGYNLAASGHWLNDENQVKNPAEDLIFDFHAAPRVNEIVFQKFQIKFEPQ